MSSFEVENIVSEPFTEVHTSPLNNTFEQSTQKRKNANE